MAHVNLTSLPSHSFPQVPQEVKRVREFTQLINERDAAAYQVVGVLQNVVAFLEAQTFEESIGDLKQVLAKYERADLAINRFYQSNKESI